MEGLDRRRTPKPYIETGSDVKNTVFESVVDGSTYTISFLHNESGDFGIKEEIKGGSIPVNLDSVTVNESPMNLDSKSVSRWICLSTDRPDFELYKKCFDELKQLIANKEMPLEGLKSYLEKEGHQVISYEVYEDVHSENPPKNSPH